MKKEHNTNIECKEAIEEAIANAYDYEKSRLNVEQLSSVIDKFGIERVKNVLAYTVQEKMFDGRFSRENKDWAKSINLPEEFKSIDKNRLSYCIVDKAHTGLVDIFVRHIKNMDKTSNKVAQTEKKSVLKILKENKEMCNSNIKPQNKKSKDKEMEI